MPKELKKRGRRADKQKKDNEAIEGPPVKRRRTEALEQGFSVEGDAGDDFISFGQENDVNEQDDQQTTFYGHLTEEEQEYYANVNNKISANDFDDDADRSNFVEAIYRESTGKEIKIASSQSCSRYLEKIIRLSTATQLQSLFLAFLEDLGYLVQHRFGSHCCETLFLESAKHVNYKPRSTENEDISFEALFLQAVDKLQPNVGFLLTERFASHTIRVLLLVLSGQPLEDTSAKDMVASRKKEKIEMPQLPETTSDEVRKVPSSFTKAWKGLVKEAVSKLDTTYLRALATSPTGNPVLQLLLRLELSNNDEKENNSKDTLLKLIPDQDFEPESDSSKFVSGLVYDSTGAYLVQTLVRYLPGKTFKRMYKNLFRDRIGKLAKNEIASYVAVSIFERVGKGDLASAVEAMLPELPGLVERNRLAVVKTLIERSSAREVDLQPVRDSLTEIYGDDAVGMVQKMLKLELSSGEGIQQTDEGQKQAKGYADLQGSLLAQTMLRTRELNSMVEDSLLAQSDGVLLRIAKNTIASRVIQAALVSDISSAKFIRQMLPRFYDIVPELAVDASGSHVVDALWAATKGVHFMKERIAKILQTNETQLRESIYGRTVWKNWSMDLYQRRPGEWQAIAKGFDQYAVDDDEKKPKKSAIELARERHMQKQARGGQHKSIAAVKASA